MARTKKTQVIKQIVHWDPMQSNVEVISMGHFPDTVIVRYNDKKCEVDVRELSEAK